VTLSGASYPSLAAAKAAGAPTLNYGAFHEGMPTVRDGDPGARGALPALH